MMLRWPPLCAFLLVLCSGTSSAAPVAAQPVPLSPQAVFGPDAVAIMTGATHVETFLIGGDGSDSGDLLERRRYARERYGVRDYHDINRYPITTVGPVQGTAFASRLKQALFDLPAYPYNGVSCFDPGVGFRVWKGRETVEMIVCFLCHHQIVVTKDARGRILHRTDVVNSPLLLTLAAEAFPQDQELQTLKRDAAKPEAAPRTQPVTPPNPNEAVSDALIRAAHNDDGTSLQGILMKIADINAPGISGEIALAFAIENGDLAMVRTLLDKGLSADGVGMWQGQALRSASSRGEQDIIRLLIDRRASVSRRNGKGETAMMSAAAGGDVEIMRLLIDHGAALSDTDADGETLLMKAAERGRSGATRFLLERGADVNAHTPDGGTALTKAASQGHAEVVRLLLDKGAALDATDVHGATALMKAAERGQTEAASCLLQHGADVKTRDRDGTTPLMQAAIQCVAGTGELECVRLFLDHSAEVNAQDHDGDTALSLVVPYGEQAIPLVRLLIAHGANVRTRDRDGETPLLRAVRCAPIMQRLVELGAAVDAVDTDGDTPLMWAADHDDLPSVRLLLRHHADVHHRDRYGDTAVTLARKDNAAKVLPALLQAAQASAGRS